MVQIDQATYLMYKRMAEKVRDGKVHGLNIWRRDYVEYYEGEAEQIYRESLNAIHEEFNKTMDNLQLMLLGIYEPV